MLRALVLSLLILCTVAASLPLVDSLAMGPRAAAAHRHRRHRRHSRAWWRRHRRRLRRRHAVAAVRRAQLLASNTQAHTQSATANPAVTAATAHALLTPALPPLALPNFSAQPAPNMPVLAVNDAAAPAPPVVAVAPQAPRKAVAPAWPSTWHSLPANGAGELRFSVRGADGRSAGAVTWSRVAAPQMALSASAQARAKTLGGVSLSDLRRKVIDRMMAEGGWVVNDMERTLGGRRTFVVIAESANADGAHVAWIFYFTEFNGQVYGLVTNTRAEQAAALASDAEQFVAALNERTNNAMTASRKQR
jgi:hypothetical protein